MAADFHPYSAVLADAEEIFALIEDDAPSAVLVAVEELFGVIEEAP